MLNVSRPARGFHPLTVSSVEVLTDDSAAITFSVPDSLEGVLLVARIRIDPKNIIGQNAPATDLRNDFATFIDPAGGTNFGANPIDQDADGVLLNIPPYVI